MRGHNKAARTMVDDKHPQQNCIKAYITYEERATLRTPEREAIDKFFFPGADHQADPGHFSSTRLVNVQLLCCHSSSERDAGPKKGGNDKFGI